VVDFFFLVGFVCFCVLFLVVFKSKPIYPWIIGVSIGSFLRKIKLWTKFEPFYCLGLSIQMDWVDQTCKGIFVKKRNQTQTRDLDPKFVLDCCSKPSLFEDFPRIRWINLAQSQMKSWKEEEEGRKIWPLKFLFFKQFQRRNFKTIFE